MNPDKVVDVKNVPSNMNELVELAMVIVDSESKTIKSFDVPQVTTLMITENNSMLMVSSIFNPDDGDKGDYMESLKIQLILLMAAHRVKAYASISYCYSMEADEDEFKKGATGPKQIAFKDLSNESSRRMKSAVVFFESRKAKGMIFKTLEGEHKDDGWGEVVELSDLDGMSILPSKEDVDGMPEAIRSMLIEHFKGYVVDQRREWN